VAKTKNKGLLNGGGGKGGEEGWIGFWSLDEGEGGTLCRKKELEGTWVTKGDTKKMKSGWIKGGVSSTVEI